MGIGGRPVDVVLGGKRGCFAQGMGCAEVEEEEGRRKGERRGGEEEEWPLATPRMSGIGNSEQLTRPFKSRRVA